MQNFKLSRKSFGCSLFAVTVIMLALISFAVRVRAQSTRTFTEWSLPSATNCPFNVFASSRDVIYFTESRCNGNPGQVGKLDASINTVTEWTGGGAVIPQGLIVLGDRIAFADGGTNTIDLFNPKTNNLMSWSVPSSGALNLVAVGTQIFFTELNASKIGRLNLLTNELTEWTLPGGSSGPLGIARTEDGSEIWFTTLSGAQVELLDPDDGRFEQWTLPSSVLGHHVQHIAVSERGHAFFVDDFSGSVNELDRETNVLTSWTAPFPPAPVVDLLVRDNGENEWEGDQFRIEFTDSNGRIGRLLTALQMGTQTTLSPNSVNISPLVTVVTPSLSTLAPTSSVITPAVTSVTGVTTGGFEEWLVPTTNSDTYAIGRLPGGGVVFSEANRNKIGTLR